MRKRGFTLIELLVVIAIIAILAAILFPVFAQARESARLSACTSNMKQIGLGILMYADDFDELFPPRRDYLNANYDENICRTWKHLVTPYIKNSDIFQCPTNPAARVADEAADSRFCPTNLQQTPRFMRGYFYYRPFFKSSFPAGSIGWWRGAGGYSQASISHPANALIAGENKDIYPDYGPWMSYYRPGSWGNEGYSNWSARHRGSEVHTTLIFADGHVKYHHWEQTCFNINPDNTNMWQYNCRNPSDITNGNPNINWLNTFCYTLLNRVPCP